ncbi:MAG: protein BatD [Candidatus Cloacimonetes bacterium]|nr:protein BatD [Candidatus Cloacimonadota bacterium]
MVVLIGVLFVLNTLVGASQVSLTILADRVRMSEFQTVTVDFQFDGLSQRPTLSGLDFPDFDTLSTANSSSIRIMNGERSESFTIRYVLRPKRQGQLAIGPYRVQIGTQTLESNQVVIQVDAREAVSETRSEVFVKARLSKNKVYTGDQLSYELKIYRLRSSRNIGRLGYNQPQFQDVIVETDASTQQETTEVLEGQVFQVTTITIPMFAVKTGIIPIPEASLTYVVREGGRRGIFDDFFQDDFFGGIGGGSQKQVFSEPLTLEVMPLPLGAPDSFQNLVGQYAFKMSLSQTDLKVGENLTMTLRLEGTGSLQDWSPPEIKLDGFRVYRDGDGQLERLRTTSGMMGGIKTVQYALIPTTPGERNLGPFEFSYFDPSQAQYIQTTVPAQVVRVTGGLTQEPEIPYVSVPRMEQTTPQEEPRFVEDGLIQKIRDPNAVKKVAAPLIPVLLFVVLARLFYLAYSKMKLRNPAQRFLVYYGKSQNKWEAFLKVVCEQYGFEYLAYSYEELNEKLKSLGVSQSWLSVLQKLCEQEQYGKYALGNDCLDHQDWVDLLKNLPDLRA